MPVDREEARHGRLVGRLRTGARRTAARTRGGGRGARPRPRRCARRRAQARAARVLPRGDARAAPRGRRGRRARRGGRDPDGRPHADPRASPHVSDRTGLRAAKQAMRVRMRELRDAIPPEERRSLAQQIEARLFALPALGDAETVMLSSSFGTEVPTQGMIERAWEAGQRVVLPLLRHGAIRVAAVRRGQALRASGYGPMEPPDDEPVPAEEIEVVVAPGLAFDGHANRLGYGGGH